MATIQNERDKLLQAAPVRVVPPAPLEISDIAGLPDRLDAIGAGAEVGHLMNNSDDLVIRATDTALTSSTNVTLTAIRKNGLTGAVTWSLFAGSAVLTPSGDSCAIAGTSITSASITVKAVVNGREAYATIAKLGALSMQNTVDLASQVTGRLASGSVTGLGALALLNAVDLNTQTTGALNGATQVTNLGSLAFANALAANQIGAGQLAAGVVYAGSINATQVTSGSFAGKTFTGGTFTGGTFQTSGSGSRLVISDDPNGFVRVYSSDGNSVFHASNSGVSISGRTGGVNALTVGSLGHGIAINNANGAYSLRLAAISTLPTAFAGAIAYHSTHGFIFANGSGWAKPTWAAI